MTTRVAVDALGGDHAPEPVLAGVAAAVDDDPDLSVVLVGPPQQLAGLAPHPRISVIPAEDRVAMDDEPVQAVRSRPDATVRVTMRCVRDGAADAAVSAGPTGATLAAALFTLGRIPGVTRPAVAVSIPAAAGPVLLVDAGGNVDCRPDLLLQFALTGASLFTVRHGVHDPRVGLLNIGSERGKGDAVRKQTYELLADAPLSFVGNVEPAAVMAGGVADVVVADGFSGNVLLKALEAMHARLRGVVAASGSAETLASVDALSPDRGAGFVLGVDGTVVVGHGAAGPRAVASYVAAAAAAARAGLLPRLTEVMGALVRRRRDLAGLA